MKNFTLGILCMLFSFTFWAQSPDKMSYQAVIRDASTNLITSSSVSVKISILQGSASGTTVYVETQVATTNTNGLISLEIGSGSVVSGNFATIDWGNGPYYIKTETDPVGGASYTIVGTSQLLSVPYALYAKNTLNALNSWSTTGNSETNPATNFIGTTDNKPLIFKVNNLEAGKIDGANFNVFFGSDSGANVTTGQGNTGIGARALVNNTTGLSNTAVGFQTLYSNTDGYYNVAIGRDALYNNTTGNFNIAVGYGSLNTNNSSYNIAIGYYALKSNTVGIRNVAIGSQTLRGNTSGYDNTAVGYETLFSNTTGSNNTATGSRSLYRNTTGFNNVAMGNRALNKNTAGSSNTAVGFESMLYNTIGNSNTAYGFRALNRNLTASWNTAIGSTALNDNTTGASNTAVGFESLRYNTVGSSNVAYGYRALNRNTTANDNTAIGNTALQQNSTGSSNTAVGTNSLFRNTTGNSNTAVGKVSLYTNTTGNNNVAMGFQTLYFNTTGYSNTAIGVNALYKNTTGYSNAAVGLQSLSQNTTGDNNVAMGFQTLLNTVLGTQNTAVGALAGSTGDFSNSTAIGYNVQNTASNQVRIGNSAVTTIGGQVSWTTISDKRFKKDIKENVLGLNFIMKLRPVTYHLNFEAINNFFKKSTNNSEFKETKNERPTILQTGFLAQEVESAAKETGYEFSGIDVPRNNNDYYGLRYSEFVVPLVKAVQEQQIIIKKQQNQINELKNLMKEMLNR